MSDSSTLSISADDAALAPAVPTLRARTPWRVVAIAILAAAAIAVPFVMSDYRIFLVTSTLITAIAVLGLNMLVGYNGQLSLGHGALYAMGAYVTAILMEHAQFAWWATLPISALICFVFGFLFGWPALRLKGHYLALATFALALATPQLLKHKALEPWTGGVQGITLLKPEAPFGWKISTDQWLYLVVLAITAVLFAAAWNILRGRLGRATVAIREQPIAASAMGINVPYVKAMTFGISALYTGVAGSLGSVATAFVAPDSFNTFVSVFFLVGAVVGGLGTISGALVGAAFIQFVPNLADQISKAAPSAIFAGFLILCMFLMPQGFVGLVRSALQRLRRQRPRRGD
ncbi:branched-chain amino acid ABC transporter permease [Ramlibacter sp. 2FC]|uniref:branched-chain amino acid ABC transporter permease n=1 Tax=Ramlibacter sp. 2FC TaxID=2502188 RepID=UPI0010F9EB62|nr:branched-chain amino acid ABC transporter permease [Ramlibacter sp. 2FC]